MILRVIWVLIPIFFFGLSLWDFLEAIRKKHSLHDCKNLLHQALLLSACALASILIDLYAFPSIPFDDITDVTHFDSLFVCRVLLFPVITVIFAKIAGPTKGFRIKKGQQIKHRDKYDPLT